MEGEFRKLSDAFSALGSALATRANHALSDVQKAHRTISELPAELTPAMLRGMVEKYSKLAGEWTSIRKQLEGYGL